MKRIATLLCLLIPLHANAESAKAPAESLLNGLVGQWSGALQYRDYQSGELEEITLDVDFSKTDDDATLIQRSVFQDPGFKVYTVTVSTIDAESGLRHVGFFRDRKAEHYSDRISVVDRSSDPLTWTIVLEREGLDDDSPARIREVLRRNGDDLTWEKQVGPAGDAPGEFEFRNRLVLARR